MANDLRNPLATSMGDWMGDNILSGFHKIVTELLRPIFTVRDSRWTGGLAQAWSAVFQGLMNLTNAIKKQRVDGFITSILNTILIPLYLVRLLSSIIRLHPIVDILTALSVLAVMLSASIPAFGVLVVIPYYLGSLSQKVLFRLM